MKLHALYRYKAFVFKYERLYFASNSFSIHAIITLTA